MRLAPDATLDDGLVDVVLLRRPPEVALPARPRRASSSGTHLRTRPCELVQARELHVDAERPFRIYADGDPIGMTPGDDPRRAPRPSASWPLMTLLGAQGRRRARRRRAVPARRARRHVAPRPAAPAHGAARDRRAAARLHRGSASSARRTARRRPPRWSPRSWAAAARGSSTTAPGANMAGGVATRAHGRRRATWASSRSTSSGSTASSPSVRPRAMLLANLFRDQLDRYGELETIADRWAAVVAGVAGHRARAQRRRPARRRPRPRPRRRRSTSASTTTASRWRAWRTHRTPSTAAAAAPRTSTTPSTSATSAATTARTATRAARSRRSPRRRVVLDGTRGADVTLRTPQGDGRRRASRCPASTTSTTRSPRPAWRWPSARRWPTSRPAWRRSRRRSAARRRVRLGDRELTLLLVKNPAGANEVLRTLTLDDGEHDLLASSTTTPPTGTTSPGSGTPTSRSSRRACAARPAAAPARPSSRCA